MITMLTYYYITIYTHISSNWNTYPMAISLKQTYIILFSFITMHVTFKNLKIYNLVAAKSELECWMCIWWQNCVDIIYSRVCTIVCLMHVIILRRSITHPSIYLAVIGMHGADIRSPVAAACMFWPDLPGPCTPSWVNEILHEGSMCDLIYF